MTEPVQVRIAHSPDSDDAFMIYAMTQGGPGDTLMVFQVEAYLNFFQSTNVGRSAALLMILWVVTYFLSYFFIKSWLRLRERARGEA